MRINYTRVYIHEEEAEGDGMTKEEKLKRCIGCEQNFYNGNNDLGVEECWNLKNATLMLKKEVCINQVPPWNQAPREFLSCFQRKGFIYVDPEKTC
jgi:hypothetical protein